jgi:CRISPR type IV-associated protein Csf1
VVEYSPFPAEDVEDGICFLCGGETHGKGQPTKKAIKPTFTDMPYARALDSNAVCDACAFCLSYRELRNYALVATETELMHPGRPQVKDLLLNPPEPPFVICIAVSGQKWIHFKSQVNYSREAFSVNLEEGQVKVEPAKLRTMLETIEYLYAVFSKEEILSGRYNQKRIKDFGMDRFSKNEDLITELRGSRLFGLAVFVAQKQEKPEPQEVKKGVAVAEIDAGGRAENQGPAQLGFNWL